MKAISKVIAAVAVSALAFGMFGCSGGSDSASSTTNADEATVYTSEDINASDIEVEKSGFTSTTQDSVDADGNPTQVPAVDFAFIVKNNNAGYVAQNVPFNVNGYNANGEVVFSGGATCQYIYPGIETAVSGSTAISAVEGMDTTVTEFTVEPMSASTEWLKTSLTDSELASMFTVDEASAENIDGTLTITASVTGDLADANKIYKIADLEDTLEGHCVAIFTDESGNIVFGSDPASVLIDKTMLENSQTEDGESVPLNNVSMAITNPPAYADFEIYVMPGL